MYYADQVVVYFFRPVRSAAERPRSQPPGLGHHRWRRVLPGAPRLLWPPLLPAPAARGVCRAAAPRLLCSRAGVLCAAAGVLRSPALRLPGPRLRPRPPLVRLASFAQSPAHFGGAFYLLAGLAPHRVSLVLLSSPVVLPSLNPLPPPASRVLPLVVAAQFACTSLWFAGNAVVPGLLHEAHLTGAPLSAVVSAVQFGFIVGTLVFALLALADRLSPSRLFLLCAIAGSLANAGLLLPGPTPATLLALRFAVGFFLAGIYPVGMKIAADYVEGGLGCALGYLVGALVLGTALPHLLRSLVTDDAWRSVVLATSGLALAGGVLLWWRVPDGPFRRPGGRQRLGEVWQVFRHQPFRAAALGYFGHMWELYTFWAFVPLWLWAYQVRHPETGALGPGWTFAIIALGAPGLAVRATAAAAVRLASCCARRGRPGSVAVSPAVRARIVSEIVSAARR